MSIGETKPSRILVVRLGAMGDIIHTLPAVASLKRSYPDSEITWAVEPRWTPLLEGNPFVDRLLRVERRDIAGVLRTIGALRHDSFDLAIDFQGLIKSALVTAIASVPRTFGLDSSQTRETLAALFYSNRVVVGNGHIVDRHLDLAAAAGARERSYVFPLPQGAPDAPLPDSDFVLASPLAGWTSKQWPTEFYSQLSARLKAALGMTLVVNGPPSSVEILRQIQGAHVHLSGIPGLIFATRHAVSVVGVDSGPLHIAAALEKPGVAIFGPTDPTRNGPFGGSIRVLRSSAAVTSYKRKSEIDPSMRAITPDQVFIALEKQMQVQST